MHTADGGKAIILYQTTLYMLCCVYWETPTYMHQKTIPLLPHLKLYIGISRALCKPSTVSATYLLDYVLPQVAKLSRALRAERIDLTAITPMVDATLNTLDKVTLPAANWVLELMDERDDIEEATKIEITTDSITTFQERVAQPIVTMLTVNIYQADLFHKTLSPHLASLIQIKKVPAADSSETWLPMGRTRWI